MKAAAHEFSRFGYADSSMERVANAVWSSVGEGSPAGGVSAGAAYSRPELHHLFRSKEELALAVVPWFEKTWYQEVGHLLAEHADPVRALLAVARAHAAFCRKGMPPFLTALRAEFDGRDHPVGHAVNEAIGHVIDDTQRLIAAGRTSGAIPPGPPPRSLALGFLGVIYGLGIIHLSGPDSSDDALAERGILGLLGVVSPTSSTGI